MQPEKALLVSPHSGTKLLWSLLTVMVPGFSDGMILVIGVPWVWGDGFYRFSYQLFFFLVRGVNPWSLVI
jgi:hypothetical protein